MPKIPTYDGPQVRPQGLPGVRQAISSPPVVNIQGPAAEQQRQMGAAMERAGGALGDLFRRAKEEADKLRVDEAVNQARALVQGYTFDPKNGYMAAEGKAAIERASGKPLAVEYADKLAEDFADIAKGLGNDEQRQLFATYSRQALGRFQGQVMQHEAREYMRYRAHVREGTVANRTQEMALNYDDPQAVAEGIADIKGAILDLGLMQGWGEEKVAAEQRKATSKAHRAVLLAAMQNNDLGYATKYYSQNIEDMEPDDILRVGGLLQESVDLSAGQMAADAVFIRNAGRMAPTEFDRAFDVLIGMESGGQQFGADGQTLRSSAGAVGIAQVMPGTGPQAARLAGVKWDEEKFRTDAEYNELLGRAYFAEQVKAFDGDLGKAYAAYNAGPRWVQQAAQRAAKAKPGTEQADWFWQLNNDDRSAANRKQTREYVERGLAQFAAGLGARKPSLPEMKAELRADPRIGGNPQRLRAAEARLEAQYKDMAATLGQQTEEAMDAVYKTLWANGGDMAALPTSLRAAIPGDKLSAVLAFADKAAKGPANNAEAWAEILSLPKDTLAAMTPSDFYRQFRPVLDDAHLEKGYALIADAKGVADEKHLEIITTSERVKRAAMGAGIIPANGSKPDKNQMAGFARFTHEVDERIRQFEQVDLKGERRANSKELQSILDDALMDTVSVSRSLWFDTKDKPVVMLDEEQLRDAYVMVGEERVPVASIPKGQRAEIILSLRTRGFPVTEQAIAQLWVEAGKPKD